MAKIVVLDIEAQDGLRIAGLDAGTVTAVEPPASGDLAAANGLPRPARGIRTTPGLAAAAVSHSTCVTPISRAKIVHRGYTLPLIEGDMGGVRAMHGKTCDTEDRDTELMALARLVAYALESSRSLDAEVVEVCLEKALEAVLDQIDDTSRTTLTTGDIILINRSALC